MNAFRLSRLSRKSDQYVFVRFTCGACGQIQVNAERLWRKTTPCFACGAPHAILETERNPKSL